MRKIFSIISLCVLSTLLISCNSKNDVNISQDVLEDNAVAFQEEFLPENTIGSTLFVDDQTSNFMLKTSISDETPIEVRYSLEKIINENNKVTIPATTGDVFSVFPVIKPNRTHSQKFDLNEIFGKLDSGTYELTVSIKDLDDEDSILSGFSTTHEFIIE